jgi:hypothetical protein
LKKVPGCESKIKTKIRNIFHEGKKDTPFVSDTERKEEPVITHNLNSCCQIRFFQKIIQAIWERRLFIKTKMQGRTQPAGNSHKWGWILHQNEAVFFPK